MVRGMRWWLAGILVLVLCVPAVARVSPKGAYEAGMKAFQKGDYGLAVEEFSKTIWYCIDEKQQNGWPMGPEDFSMGSTAYVYRGVSYLRRGQPGKAEADFAQAEKWGGQSASARLTIGEAYFRVGRYDDSIKTLARLVVAEPNLGMAHNYLARAYYMKRDYASSWKHVKEAQKLGIPVTALIGKLKKIAPELE
jgi:tetratricopeptide (TPR) repeat protein